MDIYFYIDESGLLRSDKERFFIISCVATDTPDQIEATLYQLRQDICDHLYYFPYREKFISHGFHAVSNHPDIRTEMYKIIPYMNMRVYTIVLDKFSDFYKDVSSRYNFDIDFYAFLIKQLLRDRVKSEKDNHIHFIFEEYGGTIAHHKNRMEDVIGTLISEVGDGVEYVVEVCSKDNIILSVVDYINYILYQLLNHPGTGTRMMDNFKLVEPKIASLHLLHTKVHYGRRKNINFEEILGREEVN